MLENSKLFFPEINRPSNSDQQVFSERKRRGLREHEENEDLKGVRVILQGRKMNKR